ncbi:MAG: efflux RND transporter permease subunit [Bryobacterales bacterium]
MHKLAELCVRRPVFATMLILSLTVTGAFSFFGLGVDLFPKVDLPTVVVTVANPGASPESVETEITDVVEGAVNTISGIDELRSTSMEGSAQIVVQFSLDKNGDVAAQEVRDKVGLIVPQLPETAEEPVIQKIDPDAIPVLRVVVSGPYGLRELTTLADKKILRLISNVPGVGNATIVGGREKQIHVWVDPDLLRAHGLTVTDVSVALRQQNLEMPGGRMDEGQREVTVRTMGRLQTAEDFNEIVLAERAGYPVRVRDVGRAEDAAEEVRTISYLNAKPAVTVVVAKQSGRNTVEVADEVKRRLIEIQKTLPRDVTLEIVGDQSVFIKASVESIQTHLIEGSLLASLVILLFLSNLRTTLIAAVAIPTSIIATFALMAAMGFTLNQVTMLALTLMVGIVIDDAIIVLENIYRYIEEKGLSPFDAAIQGTAEIGLAVMATTLSLLAVFLPIGFMGGIVGRFMSSFGFTASFAIAVSALVSFTLTPMMCSRMLEAEPGDGHSSKSGGLFGMLEGRYVALLSWCMHHRKLVVAVCFGVVLSTVPLFMAIGKNFSPADDRSEFNVEIELPEGSSLPATVRTSERIAREIRDFPEVRETLTTVGQSGPVNKAQIYVRLSDIKDRKRSQAQMMMAVREKLKSYPKEIQTAVQTNGGLGGSQAAVNYSISGPDLERLEEYGQKLLAAAAAVPDVVDPSISLNSGKPELRVEIDRDRAADLGVRAGDVAQALNTLVAGQKVTTFTSGSEQYDVVLRAEGEFRSSQEGLRRLAVPSSKQGSVTLDNVVKIEEGVAASSIERLNRQRQVTVSANLTPEGSQAAVLAALDEAARKLDMPPGYDAAAAGASKELARTGYYFLLAISLSFIFMYMVLAAQFESFLHPVTILLTLPIAVPFGILSLLLAGQDLNIMAGLGLLLLFGVVKKNAILQIDHTNGLRAKGIERHEAILQANRDRLRPILMTTISLVAGMTPLVLSTGPGSATNRSIGVLVAGGQTFCLLLTLVAVPVIYSLFEDGLESERWKRATGRFKGLALGFENAAAALGRRFRSAQSESTR